MSRKIAGNIFTRQVGDKIIFVGIMKATSNNDVPHIDEHFEKTAERIHAEEKKSDVPSEALHVYSGYVRDDGSFMLYTTPKPKDIQEEARGKGIDSILTSPLWRVGP